jgi:hypothetical protein
VAEARIGTTLFYKAVAGDLGAIVWWEKRARAAALAVSTE